MKKVNYMKNDYLVRKTYASFMMVSVLSVLAATLGILIDNVIAGKMLGQEALSAMSIVGSMSYVFSCLSNLCVLGGTIKAAQALGRGEKEAPSQFFSAAVIFFAAISLLISGLGLMFPETLAAMLGARGELLEPSAQFLRGYMWSILPNMLMFALNNFAKITGAPMLPLQSILAMTVADILLDLLLVHLGMFGLGLATTFGYVAGLGVSCLQFCKKSNTLHFVRPPHLLSMLREMMKTGLPTAAVRLGEALRTVLLNHMLIISVGAGALAALNVRTQANNFFGAVTLGMGQSLLPVAGLFYGQEDRTSLKEMLWYSLRLGFLLNVLVCILLCLFPHELALVFGIRDDDVMEMTVLAILLLGVSLPLRGINYTLINYFQATKKESLATCLSVQETFALVCLCSAILIVPFSETGVWLAFIMAEVITFVIIFAYAWFCRKKCPRSLEDLMLLPEGFGEADRLEISVKNTTAEVIKAVEAALAYAEARGVDKQKMNAIGLMIEEVGTNIVKFAFDDTKDHWLDIFMVAKAGEVRLHFRDNGKPFDPIAYSDTHEVGIGLKIIRGMAQEITYSHNLILNELYVKL